MNVTRRKMPVMISTVEDVTDTVPETTEGSGASERETTGVSIGAGVSVVDPGMSVGAESSVAVAGKIGEDVASGTTGTDVPYSSSSIVQSREQPLIKSVTF